MYEDKKEIMKQLEFSQWEKFQIWRATKPHPIAKKYAQGKKGLTVWNSKVLGTYYKDTVKEEVLRSCRQSGKTQLAKFGIGV